MYRILVVANQTLGGTELLEVLRSRVAQQRCELHVVVPLTPMKSANPGGGTTPIAMLAAGGAGMAVAHGGEGDEDVSVKTAEVHLSRAIDQFRRLGVDVSGDIGHRDPVHAIQEALRLKPADEVVLATLPPGISRWLRQDVVHRARRAVAVPLTHVVCTPAELAARKA